MDNAIATAFSVDRKLFVKALEQIGRVIPTRSGKRILQCVRITAERGLLKLAGTDLETSLMVQIWGDGELPQCVVRCQELLRRVKTGKAETCELSYDGDVLIVNGGIVHHQLRTQDPKEYPPLRFQQDGHRLGIQMSRFREALKTALVGIAKESTRYAINGVLLEVNKGARLVATDGRRLVSRELLPPLETDAEFSVILTSRFCKMLTRLTDTRNEEEVLWLWVKANANEKGEKTPSDVWAVGPD
jgi:DNA polymerase III sliding clamp (beta) subunit (PCNA family)